MCCQSGAEVCCSAKFSVLLSEVFSLSLVPGLSWGYFMRLDEIRAESLGTSVRGHHLASLFAYASSEC